MPTPLPPPNSRRAAGAAHPRLLQSRRGSRPFAVTMAVLALASWPTARPSSAEDLNRIVLRVNEEILTLHEYEERKAGEITSILANPRLDSSQRQEMLEQVGRLVVQNTFSEMLLLSFAERHSIRISDAEVQEAVQDLIKRQGIENDAQLQQALASTGMTMEDLRENTRRELLWQRVVGREVQPKVAIDDEELRAYYRNHKEEFRTPEQRLLREVIVLESSDRDDTELRRVAEEIRQALAGGGDFDQVVAPYKEKEIASGPIDLDWLRADELESSLSEAAWALSPGDFSAPIAARGGYHILYVAGLREAKLKPLNEVEDLIRRREYNSRFNKELRSFLQNLEEQSYIQEDLPAEAVGYRALASDLETEDELELFRAPILETEDEEPREPADSGT